MTAASSSSMAASGKVSVGDPVSTVHRVQCGGAGGVGEVLGRGVDEEHVGQLGGLVQAVGDALEALAVGEQHGGARVLQAVEDLVRLPPAVQPHQDGTLGHGGPEGQAPLRVVLAQHRHPVPGADAVPGGQGVGHAVGLLDEVAEAVLPIAVGEERVVAAARGRLGDLPQRAHALGVHLHGAPGDVLGHDLEHAAGPGELGADLCQAGHHVSLMPLMRSSGETSDLRPRNPAATSSEKRARPSSLARPVPKLASGTISSSTPISA